MTSSNNPTLVRCKRSGPMSGGVAILIGLAFIGVHHFGTPEPGMVEERRAAILAFGYILLGIGIIMLGFTRIVEVDRKSGSIRFRLGWMVFRMFPLVWTRSFSTVDVRRHLPRFGGYLGMTSMIQWAVVLNDDASGHAAEVVAFPTKAEADRLASELHAVAPSASQG